MLLLGAPGEAFDTFLKIRKNQDFPSRSILQNMCIILYCVLSILMLFLMSTLFYLFCVLSILILFFEVIGRCFIIVGKK